ncbi:DUF4129 domain-containing protein [Segniliparus rugosus]|uniref:Protein-glutamine gamma-glutamyltransferase-like C-terminal domain-containing protein n=1 Tax=Segniliparus rugosus (strain ATCC BAA-974 / DSM 45345 / CCUG 50838 / CIP 108380 / JCM 13579 / CDC 945) TaxID=679197 RepID=E5XSB7_SEGRC|nr:DUF4129 domain-containing protein [Segniliparus rugosus]EFV12761.1 hypothetical protein HMPREF9336_02389 [Segniliparus rugosus ATCC BAA-974]
MEVDRDPAKEAAQRELTDPRYEHRTWWDDFIDWLGRRTSDRVLNGHRHSGFWDGNLMPLLVLLVILVLGALIGYYARRATRGAPKKGALFEDEAEELSSSEEHRQRAKASALAGDWATAIAERMRAAVKELDERTVLALTPGRTADEFAFLAGGLLPELEGDLANASGAFDEVVYGGRAGSERTYLDVARLDEAIPGAVRKLRKADQEELAQAGREGQAW